MFSPRSFYTQSLDGLVIHELELAEERRSESSNDTFLYSTFLINVSNSDEAKRFQIFLWLCWKVK